MQAGDALEVAAQGSLGNARQRCAAIAISLALAHEQLTPPEVDVLDAQPQCLQQAQTASVEQRRDEAVHFRELGQHRAHLVAREHDREAAADGARARLASRPSISRPSTVR